MIVGLALLFVPNKLSTAIGVGNKQNRITQTQKVDLIKNSDGTIIGTKTTTQDADEQQHITFWEWLMSLPVFVLILMLMGIVFPPIALFMGKLWASLKKGTKQIVVGVDQALDNLHDPVVKDKFLTDMKTRQDESTEKIVDKIQGKS